ncbi:MAG: PQQ-binding-like beta-propeller repeat protein, partial [bacterium]|nr:PQQ-binding-like beta-propeller repeat protein [bacterium]
DEIQCSPALVDLNNDGKQEVVVAADDVKVYAFSGADGLPLWVYTCSDGYLMHGSPSIAYLNGDSVPDVVVGSGEGMMIAIDGADGSELWTFPTGSGIAGTPGLADVTGDGIADVFFGSYDTKVYCVNGATGLKVWDYYIGPALYNVSASPAIVDVNGDSIPDCIISAVDNIGDSIGAVYALNGLNGNEIWINGDIYGNPKLGPVPAYINDDDVMDFIVTASQAEVYHIYGIDGATGDTIYLRLAQDVNPGVKTSFTSAIVGDFTGDGHVNAMIGREDGYVDLINVGDLDYPGDFGGKSLFCAMASIGPSNQIFGSPAVGDVNGDGKYELVVANLRGYVFVLDLHADVPDDILLRGWLQQSGNRWHTGTPFFEPPQ